MFKNVASQKLTLSAIDVSTGLPKSGDSANITAYVSKDDGAVTVLTDTTATEADATNAKGDYLFDLAQAETNASKLRFSGKSSTANVIIVPQTIYTTPPNFSSLGIESDGHTHADVKEMLGVGQSVTDLKDFADTGYDPAAHKVAGVVLTDTATTLTNDPSGVTTLLARLTASRAGYLDNLNVGGAVASQADILAINQSASRRIILTTVQQYERPESGNSTYTIEARTYDGDGAAVDADSTPTLTATGNISGSLAANLSTASNPATGVYRWTYTVSSSAVIEQIRYDISATMTTAFTLSAYTQVCDFVSATWTTTNASNLTAIFNKLPVNNIADQTLLNSAIAGVSGDVSDILVLLGTPTDGTFSQDISNLTGTVQTVQSRIGTFTGTGVNNILGFFRAVMRSDATTPSDIGGTYSPDTDSTQAIRDRGDAAWTTGGGGGGLTAAETRAALGMAAADLDDQLDAIAADLGAIGSGTVVSVSAVRQDGSIDIVRGDDYNNTDGTAIGWTNTDGDWPVLTGATISVTFTKPHATSATLTKAGTVVTATGTPKQIRVELTAAETTTLVSTYYTVAAVATLSSGRAVTLVLAPARILSRLGPLN